MSLSSSARCTGDVGALIPAPTDVSVDTLGKFVAIAGENGKVVVTDLANGSAIATSFDAHPAPIVRVAWAHHRFGRVLLTACENGEIGIWRAAQAAATSSGGGAGGQVGPSGAASPDDLAAAPAHFARAHVHRLPCPCNSAAWAPNEFGLMFAAAGADGQVVILCARDAELTQWDQQTVMTHGGGCHAVSWAPCAAPGTLLQMPLGVPQQGGVHPGAAAGAAGQPGGAAGGQGAITLPAPRLVTCGPERSVRIWRYLAQDRHWLQEQELADLPHEVLVVRDVAWAPNPGLPFGYVAAGTEEGAVGVWLQDGCDGKWRHHTIAQRFPAPVCRVGWSAAGSLLSVNCADGASTLWKEAPSGEWVCAFATQR